MDDIISKQQRPALLIAKERLKMLDEYETIELQAWLNADVRNRMLYNQLKQKDYTDDVRRLQQIDVEAGLQRYRGRDNRIKRNLIYRWMSVAAILIMLLTGGMFFLNMNSSPVEQINISPGGPKAILVLSDGSVRHLQDNKGEVIKVGKMLVHNTGSQLEYSFGETDSLERITSAAFNELQTPVGGEYQLTLSDGTRVWLNAQTRLRYPVNFPKGERTVYLEGEAYFEVERDEKRPFSVRMKEDVNVQVLGTAFNVRAYADENTVETVLEQGAVRMWHQADAVVLKPGIKAVYDHKTGGMASMEVDTELYTVWRKGQFMFQEQTIEYILYQLSRWYDMKVFFKNEAAKQAIFSGSVRKYETVRNILDAMEASGGVRFEIDGNTVIVDSVD